MGSRQQFNQLCEILGDGVIGSVWMYGSSEPDTIEASLETLPVLIEALGVGIARYLKVRAIRISQLGLALNGLQSGGDTTAASSASGVVRESGCHLCALTAIIGPSTLPSYRMLPGENGPLEGRYSRWNCSPVGRSGRFERGCCRCVCASGSVNLFFAESLVFRRRITRVAEGHSRRGLGARTRMSLGSDGKRIAFLW